MSFLAYSVNSCSDWAADCRELQRRAPVEPKNLLSVLFLSFSNWLSWLQPIATYLCVCRGGKACLDVNGTFSFKTFAQFSEMQSTISRLPSHTNLLRALGVASKRMRTFSKVFSSFFSFIFLNFMLSENWMRSIHNYSIYTSKRSWNFLRRKIWLLSNEVRREWWFSSRSISSHAVVTWHRQTILWNTLSGLNKSVSPNERLEHIARIFEQHEIMRV